jgi:hypothetical protein
MAPRELNQTDPGDETQPPKGVCSYCGARCTGSICPTCDALYEDEAWRAYHEGREDT